MVINVDTVMAEQVGLVLNLFLNWLGWRVRRKLLLRRVRLIVFKSALCETYLLGILQWIFAQRLPLNDLV